MTGVLILSIVCVAALLVMVYLWLKYCGNSDKEE